MEDVILHVVWERLVLKGQFLSILTAFRFSTGFRKSSFGFFPTFSNIFRKFKKKTYQCLEISGDSAILDLVREGMSRLLLTAFRF